MKICVVGDVHLSQYSSIIRKRSKLYSMRLENCIQSINWAERQAEENGCDCIVYLGDFFDRPDLNAEEITALQDIEWSIKPHYFLVGNHEMGMNDLSYSSAHNMKRVPLSTVINEPAWIGSSRGSNIRLLFLPYILESNRKNFKEYIDSAKSLSLGDYKEVYDKVVVFSHNDLEGIRYGQYVSKSGFNVEEIFDNCEMYINGHLHNQQQINEKIINLGNLTGQNFSEDAEKYSHTIGILDLNTMKLDLINNPYAFNFYKFEISKESDIEEMLVKCKNNSVLTLKVNEDLFDLLKEKLNSMPSIIEYRIIIKPKPILNESVEIEQVLNTNHVESFKNYILSQLDNTDILKEELSLLA